MFHWNDGMEIDLRDENNSGMTITFTSNNGIQLYSATNGQTTLLKRVNWTS